MYSCCIELNCFSLLQASRSFSLRHESTFDAELQDARRFQLLPATGHVVFWGKENKASSTNLFHIYETARFTSWRKYGTAQAPCKHVAINMLPAPDGRRLVLACWRCSALRMCDILAPDHPSEIVFVKHNFNPGQMVYGEDGTIFVIGSLHSKVQLLLLKIENSQFTMVTSFDPDMAVYNGLCYLPAPHNLVAISYDKTPIIRALSCKTGGLVWEVKEPLSSPHAMLYIPQYDVILVPDGGTRVLVLHPGDGSLLHTVDAALPDRVPGRVINTCLYKDRLVVHHYVPSTQKVSVFSLMESHVAQPTDEAQ